VFTDLHLHTTFSDGTYSPEELTAEAKRFGLVAVALTDHDTVEGCVRMRSACDASGIEFIPATELTCEVGHVELHMLGYYLDVTHPRLLLQMARFQKGRHERIKEIVAR
jgi:predicted metal-dependent phosphoesterase TrpH